MCHPELQNGNTPLVTVIMPVHNTQKYLSMSISSILAQTYPYIELICVDDGSTDQSNAIIRKYTEQDSRVRVYRIENHGQGYARNFAVPKARGAYLMFMDSDDYIEKHTLETAISRLETDQSDFCVFDWHYDDPKKNTEWYLRKDPFFISSLLEGEECLQLLQTNPIFMVNKVFRTSFYKENAILFSENHIYEDNPPWIRAVFTAQKVSIVNERLYRVTTRPTSSTQVDRNSEWHCKSFLSATDESIVLFEEFYPRLTEHAKYWFLLYFYNKFAYYFFDRTPLGFRKQFLCSFVDMMHRLGDILDFKERKAVTLIIRFSAFTQKKYATVFFLAVLSEKIHPGCKKILQKARRMITGFSEEDMK